MNRRGPLARIVLAVCVLTLVIGGLVAARIWPSAIADEARKALQLCRDLGQAGWIGFAAAQIAVAVSGLLPASLLGVAAGAIYGLPFGFALAAASSLTGAALAFVLSRSLFRPFVESRLRSKPRLQNFDLLLARDGWRTVCLLRVSPVMPFAATSYALGLSSISLRDYLTGTLASLPALLGYVFIGTIADTGLSTWNDGGGLVRPLLLGAGGLATLLLTLRVGFLAKRAGLLPSFPAVENASEARRLSDLP